MRARARREDVPADVMGLRHVRARARPPPSVRRRARRSSRRACRGTNAGSSAERASVPASATDRISSRGAPEPRRSAGRPCRSVPRSARASSRSPWTAPRPLRRGRPRTARRARRYATSNSRSETTCSVEPRGPGRGGERREDLVADRAGRRDERKQPASSGAPDQRRGAVVAARGAHGRRIAERRTLVVDLERSERLQAQVQDADLPRERHDDDREDREAGATATTNAAAHQPDTRSATLRARSARGCSAFPARRGSTAPSRPAVHTGSPSSSRNCRTGAPSAVRPMMARSSPSSFSSRRIGEPSAARPSLARTFPSSSWSEIVGDPCWASE